MSEQQKRLLLGFLLLCWVVYCGLFWSKALFYDQLGNLVAGHVNIWGDWAAHITMGTAMAERGPLLQVSPLLIGQPFAYPFVSDMISGLLLQIGLPLIFSFTFPSFLFSVFFVVVLFWFYRVLFKSRKIALIATFIFMLNGGVGFYYFAQDVLHSVTPLHTLQNPPHEYTRLDKQSIKWISVIDSMIIPQRAFVLGFPLALIALGMMYQSAFIDKKSKTDYKKIVAAGSIVGFLPIIHTHSFLALFIIFAFWACTDVILLWQKYKKFSKLKNALQKWATLAGVVSILALPLIWLFLSKNVSHSFFKWYPGWLAVDFKINWLVFWFKNWTITPLLALLSWALLFNKKNHRILKWALLFTPFFGLFVAANLVLFQPFAWDNTKLIIWSSLGFSGLSAVLIQKFWDYADQAQLTILGKKIVKLLTISIFILLTASGAIDAYYIVRHDLHSHTMFSKEEVELATWAKENTAKDSIWLTGDQHNHWVFVLTGRQALMTYRGWLWTQGYNYLPIESAVSRMFTNPQGFASLFEEYKVDYIVVGPNERNVWRANEAALTTTFSIVKKTQNYTVFSTMRP